MTLKRILKLSVIGLLFGTVAVAVMAGFVYLIQLLWNGLVPELFGGPLLTYWQMLGLLVLAKVILWPLGGGKGNWRRHRGGPGRMWGARWESMSPEDRERFKEKMKEKWCMPRQAAPSSQQPGSGAL